MRTNIPTTAPSSVIEKQAKHIVTSRVGDKLFVMNGVDPLAYVNLTKVNKGSKYKAIVRYPRRVFRFMYRIKSKW